MIAALFSFSYSLLIFALVGEAETEWLIIAGMIGAGWMAFAGMMAGIQSSRS
jgi:hypothetical protein